MKRHSFCLQKTLVFFSALVVAFLIGVLNSHNKSFAYTAYYVCDNCGQRWDHYPNGIWPPEHIVYHSASVKDWSLVDTSQRYCAYHGEWFPSSGFAKHYVGLDAAGGQIWLSLIHI